jgi:hypothetical protein
LTDEPQCLIIDSEVESLRLEAVIPTEHQPLHAKHVNKSQGQHQADQRWPAD